MSETAAPRTETRNNRARIVLGVVLALLILLLAGLAVFFVQTLSPSKGPAGEDAELNGLEWVRSMYGFGPSSIEQLLDPTSVAFAPDGRVYVTDPQRSRIMIFNADGTFDSLLHTGAGGMGAKQFLRPTSVDVDQRGDVYIADSFANKLIVFNSANEFVREWKIPADEKGSSGGVYVDGNDVYVVAGGKVFLYDRSGKQIGTFGGKRGRENGMIDPYQGIVAKDSKIYIADALNARMSSFDKSGKVIWTVPKARSDSQLVTDGPYQLPQDVTFDGNGRLVTIDAFAFEMIVVDPKSGKVLKKYGRDGTAEGQFFYPTGIDYDPVHDWFAVADTRNNRVQIVRIPGSGGGAGSALRRALDSPYKYCALPLLLLLIALIVGVVTSRRRRERDDDFDEDVDEDAVIQPA